VGCVALLQLLPALLGIGHTCCSVASCRCVSGIACLLGAACRVLHTVAAAALMLLCQSCHVTAPSKAVLCFLCCPVGVVYCAQCSTLQDAYQMTVTTRAWFRSLVKMCMQWRSAAQAAHESCIALQHIMHEITAVQTRKLCFCE
jgi:hypothetical protein